MNQISQNKLLEFKINLAPFYEDLKTKTDAIIFHAMNDDLDFAFYNSDKDVGFGEPYTILNFQEVVKIRKTFKLFDDYAFILKSLGKLQINPVFDPRIAFLTQLSKAKETNSKIMVIYANKYFQGTMGILAIANDMDLEETMKELYPIFMEVTNLL